MAFNYNSYDRLDYIRSTGARQYIQLPTIQTDKDFEIEFEMSAPSYNATWLPVSINCYSGGIWLGIHSSRFVVRTYAGSDYISVSPPTVNVFTKIKVKRVGTTTSLYFDDVLQGSYNNIPYSQSSGYATKVFTDESNYSIFSLRSYKYTYDGSVVLDLVPALQKYDSRTGMYDVQNETFYRNWGNSEFAYELCPQVNVDVEPSGSGTITGDGYYNTGSTALLTANANNGYAFDYWTLNGYTKLDYIQSSGTQYIDTGLTSSVATRNLRMVVDMANPSPSGYQVCGVAGLYGAYVGLNGTAIYYGIGTGNLNTGVSVTSGHRIKYDLDVLNSRYEVTDIDTNTTLVDISVARSSATQTGSYPYTLIGYNGTTPFSARLYSSQFYINGDLVRDYIPVVRQSDGAIGMLDLCEMKFYGNSGTGTFTGGTSQGSIVFEDNPLSIVVGGDLSLTANFKVSYYIDLTYDSTLGSASFYWDGSNIVLSAEPNSSGQFIGWYINSSPLSVLNPYTYTPTGNVTIEARFGRVYTITDSVSGQGYIQYTRGQDQNDVTFTTIADENWHFAKYTVNGTDYTANPLSLHLTQNTTITAVFEEDDRYHISVSSNFPYGSFYLSDNDVYSGTTVTIWARPFPDYNFVRWQDGETDNPRQITVTSNVTIVAEYQRVSDTNGIYQYRCFIKDQLDLTAYPKAFLRVDTFDIRTDLLTNATSSITTMEMLSDVDEGDVVVLYDPKGQTLYTGVINSIEDRTIDCSQMQSFYKGNWIYNTAPSSYLEQEVASLLQDYADGKMRGSSYIDSLVAQRLGGITIDYTGSTVVNLPSTYEENSDSEEWETIDFEEFIYSLYQKYQIIFDFEINVAGPNYVHIKKPNFEKMKVGNNMFAISNMTPITEVEETNRLIIYGSDKTYRSTYVATKNGIVEQPSTTANRFNITNTEIVFSDDPVADLVAANLPQTMYNHKLEFTLMVKNFIYEFGDFNLGGELDVYYGDEYYNSVLTGYEMQKASNKNITEVDFVCGIVRTKLTQLLSLGKV